MRTVARYISYILNRPIIREITPESWFLRVRYYFYIGKKLNLENPITYNEKLQWLKLYYQQPMLNKLADKYEVRNFVANRIGENHLIPLIGGPWDKFEDIDFDMMPKQFVLKTTHDSGGVVICRNKDNFDIYAAKEIINTHLKRKFYWIGREWSYKKITPRIVAEKYIVDESGYELKDYKIFCFNGVPKVIQVDFGRFTDHKRNFYSTDWKYIGFTTHIYPTDPEIKIRRPKKLPSMLSIAKKLSKGLPHVRVDLYMTNDEIYFGELTFYHGSGFEKFSPEEWDTILGGWLDLPKENG